MPSLLVFRVMAPVNSDYFLKRHNRLEIACVLGEVRTEFLLMVEMKYGLQMVD